MTDTNIVKNKELQKNLGNQVREMVLDRMEDIEGVDKANWWPLAPGWYFVIIITLLIVIKFIWSYFRFQAYKRTWQYKISEELTQMKKNLSQENAPQIVIKLSEILRRVAMHKYSRAECAGLEGNAWLKWLTQKDETNFNWEQYGQILTTAVYAPLGKEKILIPQLIKLIDQTKKWTS